ncbi:MAG: RNA polymerase sigma-70 factor [Ignavibacteria bacterium]|jgi:RNA polymerase sigma-70 factor (ECF subfamily)|nr:RNA polymerase sigma-70 factor [Ignavibacteria bacterium]
MESEKLFVERISNGDIKAFKEFYEGLYPSVCIFANKYLNDLNFAKDLAQEAFIEYWKQKNNFNDLKAIKGFIYTVTRNKCLNHIKSREIRENILNSEFTSDDYFYEMVLEEETYRQVYQAVNNLPPQCRNIIMLMLDAKKNQEIAEELDISVNTVKTLKKNAYKELRIRLKAYASALLLLSQLLSWVVGESPIFWIASDLLNKTLNSS